MPMGLLPSISHLVRRGSLNFRLEFALNRPIDRFLELTGRYPEIGTRFRKIIHDEKLNKITSPQFQYNKAKLVAAYFVHQQQHLDINRRQYLIDSVLNERGTDTWTKFMNFFAPFVTRYSISSAEQKLLQDANAHASANVTSDSEFLTCLKDIEALGEPFQTLVQATDKLANDYLTTRIPMVLQKIHSYVLVIWKNDYTSLIQQRVTNQEDGDRTHFLRAVEARSQSGLNSSVHL